VRVLLCLVIYLEEELLSAISGFAYLCNGEPKNEAAGYFEKKWNLLLSGYLVMRDYLNNPDDISMFFFFANISMFFCCSCYR
jgi:hypothetical protein